jgi:hypothetical protein
MTAMQYTINLPADYDMAIIRRRIADRGHLLDEFPGLAFKAYAYAARDDHALPGRDNLYAPFYLWRDSDGMNAFLCSAGFAGLARDFGRPVVRTWSVWETQVTADLTAATCATREIVALPRHAALDACRAAEAAAARAALADGALTAVTALDPTHWTLVRFQLWREPRTTDVDDDRQWYRVGHVSQPHQSP